MSQVTDNVAAQQEILINMTTRLPSNLRPTTRECVHLVTRGHFLSHDKDGGHTIRYTTAENPMLYLHFMALCYRNKVIADQSFILRE